MFTEGISNENFKDYDLRKWEAIILLRLFCHCSAHTNAHAHVTFTISYEPSENCCHGKSLNKAISHLHENLVFDELSSSVPLVIW